MQTLPQLVELTSELKLEQLAIGHAFSLFQQIDRHRHFLSDFVDWTSFTKEPSDTEAFIQRCTQEAEQGKSYTWAICYQGEAVGTISFNSPIDWENKTAMFGYWLSPEVQGKGIVTQAVNRLIAETADSFQHYVLKCAVHNQRSNAVAQRCGFTFVKTLPQAEKIGDIYWDQHYYLKSITEKK